MRSLLQLLIDVLVWLFNTLKRILSMLLSKFLEINIFEKGIVLAAGIAFAAVVAPMATYIIFDTTFSINNPVAHYLMGIVLFMLVTIYFPGFISMIARVALNVAYLIGIIYLQSAHEISKAPYDITVGYYLNIITPLVYISLSFVSWLMYHES